MSKKVYLDYAATTPVDPAVFRAMSAFLKKDFGNPSSVHYFGQKAKSAVEESRQKIAGFLGCSGEEVIFTGSATEANNLSINGLLKGINGSQKNISKPHLIISTIEHHAIFEPCLDLKKRGKVELDFLPVDGDGIVKINELEKLVKPNTVLISIIYANNEIGTIQPIAEIGKLIKRINEKREFKIYFHTDAVQAVNFLDCNTDNLCVDMLTVSSHKIYGPKGAGALYIRKGTPVAPLILGGGQESGFRSGTENVPGIVGFAEAVACIQDPRTKIKNIRIRQLRDKLIKRVLKEIPDSQLIGSKTFRLPNNVNFNFKSAEGEAIVIALDQKGIAASTGSACSSKSLEPSHVLLALGLSEEEAHGSLRLTIGKYTTEEEINKVLKVLPPIIKRLREIAGVN
ncbi:MAG: cysteine desulfurase family protein [Candidatus Parcubacteria bacterium]|nr:cysteine desulfurase family protein [Candidatus Parcubacteria bacterium]